MSQVLSGEKKPCPFDFGDTFDDNEKPTFFFGEKRSMARPIQDDSHFEDLADTV